MANLVLPDLGEDVHEATVSYWHFKEGDRIEAGKDVVEMGTDKATFNIPSPVSGILTKVFFEEGQTVSVGTVLAQIKED